MEHRLVQTKGDMEPRQQPIKADTVHRQLPHQLPHQLVQHRSWAGKLPHQQVPEVTALHQSLL